MKHDDDSGILGTYGEHADEIADALALSCMLIGALCLVGIGFVAGWMVFG